MVVITLLIARTIWDRVSSFNSSEALSLASKRALPVSRSKRDSSSTETTKENSSSRNRAIKIAKHNESKGSNNPTLVPSDPTLIEKTISLLKEKGVSQAAKNMHTKASYFLTFATVRQFGSRPEVSVHDIRQAEF